MANKRAPDFLSACPICDGGGHIEVEDDVPSIGGKITCVACHGSGWITSRVLYDRLKIARAQHDQAGL